MINFLKNIASDSYTTFFSNILNGILSSVHFDWSDKVEAGRYSNFIGARKLGKSYFLDTGYVLFSVWSRRHKQILLMSATDPQGADLLREVGKLIENYTALSYLKPDSPDRWSATSLSLIDGTEIWCNGILNEYRGPHPSLVIGDDVISDKNSNDLEARNKLKERFSAVIGMLELTNDSRVILLNTCHHAMDLPSELLDNPVWNSGSYPSILNEETKEVLFPERWSWEFLEQERRNLNRIMPGSFDREYLCKPLKSGVSFPTEKALEDCCRGDLTQAILKEKIKKGELKLYFGADWAWRQHVYSDYTVYIIVGQDIVTNDYYLVDMLRIRSSDTDEKYNLLVSFLKAWKICGGYFEVNVGAIAIFDRLVKEYPRVPIKASDTSAKSRNDVSQGLPALIQLIEDRKIKFPYGDVYSQEMTKIIINELSEGQLIEGRVTFTGRHDDTVIALWKAVSAARSEDFELMLAQSYESRMFFNKARGKSNMKQQILECPKVSIHDKDKVERGYPIRCWNPFSGEVVFEAIEL